jgi:excisionase family DNA binding protein
VKAELNIPPELVSAIAEEVVASLKPLLTARKAVEDAILTPDQLAGYLHVTKQWVYERVHLGEIPHTKVGKYLRFRKSAIEKWIETQSAPAVSPLSRKLKLARELRGGTVDD